MRLWLAGPTSTRTSIKRVRASYAYRYTTGLYPLSKYIILQNIQKVKILGSFLGINYRTLEEYVGIEPTALDWKSRILATIRILHGWFHPPREHTTNSTPYF